MAPSRQPWGSTQPVQPLGRTKYSTGLGRRAPLNVFPYAAYCWQLVNGFIHSKLSSSALRKHPAQVHDAPVLPHAGS